MKVLITGANGQLGYDVDKRLRQAGHETVLTDVDNMDITDYESVSKMFKAEVPDCIVHCAAYTNVDAAEDNIALCEKINVLGCENIARCAKDIDAKVVYISTDYVFDGSGDNEWETDDKASPLSVYGKTKYEGESAIKKYLQKYFILRISWVFGINGKNFVKTMINLGKSGKNPSVVSDQIGSPTYTYDLAVLIAEMVKSDKYATYHATNEGFCSWYEFACEIFSLSGVDNIKVTPVPSSEYPTRATRPQNSRLSKSSLDKAGFNRLPSWQDALSRYIDELKNSGELN